MHHMTLAEIARGLADKKFSSEELTKTLLARIAELEPKAVSVVTPDLAASLAAVQAYLERRHLSADEAKASAGKPATQE